MRRNAVRTWRVGLFAGCALALGCTLINQYDDVGPEKIPDASIPLGDGGPGSIGPDGNIIGNPGDGGAPDAAVDPATRGAIVVGGSADVRDGGIDSGTVSEEFVLTALDPGTGSELPKAREPNFKVSAVVYDGQRDLWYILESGGVSVFPTATDPFFLHTRTLNTVTGEWKELSKLAIPPGVTFATTTAIAQRLSYVAYGSLADSGTPGPYSLVTIDTSKPEAPTISSVLDLNAVPVAAIGTLSPQISQGGFVTLAALTPGGVQYPVLTPVLLPSMSAPSMEAPIQGPFQSGANSGFGTATTNGTMEALVITRINKFGGGTAPAILSIYDPASSDPTTALIGAGSFPFGDSTVKAPAFDPCSQVAFVVGTNADTSLHAVSTAGIALPDDGGIPALQVTSAPTGHSGQGVYFEPYTKTVLTPFSQGDNFALTAFTLGGTSSAPSLTQRQSPRWVPPSDLRPNFIATKSPIPAICPQTTP